MRNILINYVSAASGGALTYLKNITPHLIQLNIEQAKGGIEFKLLVTEKQAEYLSGEIASDNCIVVKNRSGFKRLIWEHLRLPSIVADHNIDIVFTPYQVTKIVKGVENIVMLRNMEPFTFTKYRYSFKTLVRNHVLRLQTVLTLRNAQKVIAVSDYVYDHLLSQNYVSKNRLKIVHHGRDESFTSNPGEDDYEQLRNLGLDCKYIFTCGSMLPYRKCEDIINAFNGLSNDEGVKLVIAGSGTDNGYIEKLTNLSKENKNVVMLGQVAPDLMKVLFRKCHLFVTATETEACPNIAIEAMSSGCRIVSSDIRPMPEMFGDCADYYKHGEIKELTQLMLKNLPGSRQLNQLALERVQRFSWKKCAAQTYEYLIN